MGEKVDVSSIAEPFRQEIRNRIIELRALCTLDEGPLLVGFLCSQDPGAIRYAHWTRKACERDGIRYELRKVGRTELEKSIEEANDDSRVHGIMVYYPAFGNHPSFYGGTMDDYLRDSIAVGKDVEGLCHTYRYNLYHNIRYLQDQHKPLSIQNRKIQCIVPCTALSIVKILDSVGLYQSLPTSSNPHDRLQGKTITIINRSEIVGRPLSAMLANDGATVYSVDIDSIFKLTRGRLLETDQSPRQACLASDAIVIGVPSVSYKLESSWVPEGCTIVNFSHHVNVVEEEILAIPGVKYIPQIGKVTVAMLERNALRLYEHFNATDLHLCD